MIMNFPGRTGAARGAGNVVGVMLVALILTLLAAGTRASLRSAAVVSSLDQEAAVRDALLLPQQQELLPQPNCSAPTPKLLNDQKCGPDCWTAYINPSEMFAFCGDYSKNISETPSPACCAGVLNASTYFAPRCFCRYIFMPAAHMGIIPARRLALPELCNVTKFCDICSNLKPACGSSPLIIVASVVGGSVVCVIIAVLAWFFYRRKKHRLRFPDTFQDIDDIMRVESRPTLFSYSVLKKATKNFHISNKLGEGGFGSVFKGVLTDGTEVAVKQLSVGSKQGNDEFLNEVVLITSVQHRNLVKLQGCCLKGDERILVYEFLPNKSLHQALFDEEQVLQLDWLTRMKIILGTAQGLAYLHEGCRTRIIHRDIKASNILLDEDYNPKIADFGLARFFLDSQTHVSTRVAGTKGYLAPEYALRGQLTEKADVFSFGVVVLELISGRSNFDLRLPSDTAYLLDWTWDLHKKKMLKDVTDWSLVEDPCYSEEDAIRVITIALLCTQSDPTKRPIMSRIVVMLSRDANIEIPEIIQNSKPPELELTELPDVGGWNEASKHQWGSMFTKSEVSEKPEVGEIEGRVTELEACSIGESDTPRSMVRKRETNEMATGGEITPGSMFVKLGTPATLSGGELRTCGSKLETDVMPTIDETLSGGELRTRGSKLETAAMPTIDETLSGGELRTRGSKLETDAMPTIDESRTRGSRIEKLGTHCMPWNIATLGTNFLECQHESGPHISFCWRVAYEGSTLELVFCSAASMSFVVGLGLEFAKVVVSTSTWEVKIIGIGQESWELMWTELTGLDKKHKVGGIFSVKMMGEGLQDDLTNEYLGGIESAQKYGVGLSIANNRAYVQSTNVLQERDHCLVLHKIVEYLMLEEVDLAKIGNQCAVSGEAGSSSRGANNSDQVNNDGTWIGQTLSNFQSWFSKGKSKSNGDDDDNRSPSNKEPPKVEDESASKNTCKITVRPGAGGSFWNEAGRQFLEARFKNGNDLNGASIDPTLEFVFDRNGSFGKHILVTTTTSFDLGKSAPQREWNGSFGWYHNLLVTSLTNLPKDAELETTLCKLLMENPKDTKSTVKQVDTHSSTSTLERSIDGRLGFQNTHIGGSLKSTETGGKTSAREAASENSSSSDMWRGFLYRDLSSSGESSACYDFDCSLQSPTLEVLKDPLEWKRYKGSGMCGAVRPIFVSAWSIRPDDTTEESKYAFEAERTLKHLYKSGEEEKEHKTVQKYHVKVLVNHAMTHLCNVNGDHVLREKESVLKVMRVSARGI